MTTKEQRYISEAIRSVASLPGADRATVDAIAQAICFAIDEHDAKGAFPAFRTACTGRVDLSGIDRVAALAE